MFCAKQLSLRPAAAVVDKALMQNALSGCRWLSLEKDYEEEIADIMNVYDERKKRRQALVGNVVSTSCAKSITVRVEHEKYFPKYNKRAKTHRKIMAHDEAQVCLVGDTVRVVPCRPLSRKKRHALIDVIYRPPASLASEKIELSADGVAQLVESTVPVVNVADITVVPPPPVRR